QEPRPPGAELQCDLQVTRSDPGHTPDEGNGLSGRDSGGPGQGYGGLTKIPGTEILVHLNYDCLRWAVIQDKRLAGGLLVRLFWTPERHHLGDGIASVIRLRCVVQV